MGRGHPSSPKSCPRSKRSQPKCLRTQRSHSGTRAWLAVSSCTGAVQSRRGTDTAGARGGRWEARVLLSSFRVRTCGRDKSRAGGHRGGRAHRHQSKRSRPRALRPVPPQPRAPPSPRSPSFWLGWAPSCRVRSLGSYVLPPKKKKTGRPKIKRFFEDGPLFFSF